MPVDERTRQPYGLLHGGASVVLAETLGSIAGGLCAQIEGQHPLLIRIIGRDAAHLQRADLGQAGLQLHFDRCAL